jgi:hypothetical protein
MCYTVKKGIHAEAVMYKVKSFTTEIKIFETRKELEKLDQMVNDFIAANKVTKLKSVSDCCTTDDSGATIGIVRTIAYQQD